jgi:hypothetical protein
MAIIYSYPKTAPLAADLLIVSRQPSDPDETANYSVSVSDIATLVTGLQQYTLKAGTKAGTSVPLTLDSDTGTDSTVNFTEGSNITLTQTSATEITIAASSGISGSGVSGQVVFWDGTSSINGNNNLFWDNTNNYLGIGTASPSSELDVAGRAVIGTGNTVTGYYTTTVIGKSNNLTNDTIVDSYTNLVLGDYGAGRYGNTVISDRTLRLGRADDITATSSNTTGILNFNDSVQGNSAFSNVGGFVGYFPPPTATNNYNFFNAYSENVLDSVFQPGASPTADRMAVSMDPNINCVGYKFDSNTSNGGGVYYTVSQNNASASSRGIVTFDCRHQNQNYAAPDGHALFEVTSGYGQTKFIIKQVSGSSNVGIGVTTPASKLEVDGGDIEIDDSASGLILRSPNGTRYRVQVDNSGNLTTTAV